MSSKKYISNINIKIREAVKEENLEYLKNILMDFLHFGLVIENSNIIFIISEIKHFITSYLFAIEEYPKETTTDIKKKAFEAATRVLPYINEDILQDNEIEIEIFTLLKNLRIETEKLIHENSIRGQPKSRFRFIPEFMEGD